MTHILLATGIFPPDIGWPASYVPKIAKRMLQDNLIPIVITYSDSPYVQQFDSLGYQVVRITRSKMFVRHYLKYRWAVLQRWRKCKHIFLQDYFSAGIPTLLANIVLWKRITTKVVGIFSREQAQNNDWTTDLLDTYVVTKQKWRLELIKKIEVIALNTAHQIITPSNYMQDLLIRFGVSPKRIRVVYNSFDPFVFAKIEVEQRKQQLNVSDKKIYVAVGRLVERKNFDTLISAFQHVDNAILYIIGDGPLKAQLQQHIQQTAQTEKIVLVGSLGKDEVYSYYQIADAFVLISSYEGMSHVLLEAMAMGLFIISSDIVPNVETLNQYTYKRIVTVTDQLDLSLPDGTQVKSAPDLSAFDFEVLYGKLKETLLLK